MAWTAEHDSQLTRLWPTSMSQAAIGREMGFSAVFIAVKAEELNLPPRKKRSRSRDELYLIREANKRNMSRRELKALLVRVILRDRMIEAVLDDESP